MTQPSDTLPKYFKDEAGFCYIATPMLAKLPQMTPWDGAVDANGFAADEPEQKPAKSRPARTKSAQAAEQPDSAQDDEA